MVFCLKIVVVCVPIIEMFGIETNNNKVEDTMNPSSFEFIPECDRDSFTENDPLSQIQATEPPPVLTQSTIDESSSLLMSTAIHVGPTGP